MRDELRYKDLSPAQRRQICNGCGPMGWGWLVPDFCFGAAGNRHDFAYWMGGGWVDKFAADLEFLANCIRLALNRRRRRRLVRNALLSFVYFGAVLLGGRRSFNFGPRKTRADLAALEN